MLYNVGPDGDKFVLGRYDPTLDGLALLCKTDNFKYQNFAQDVFSNPNPLERAIQNHELLGHIRLTKHSSYWTWIFMTNYSAYIAYLKLITIIERDLLETHYDMFRTNLLELIFLEEMVRYHIELWMPLQEARANFSLMGMKKQIDDGDIIKKCNALIELNNMNSGIIKKLTEDSEIFFEELDTKDALNFLDALSLIASSPETIMVNEIPNNVEELKTKKKEEYQLKKRLFYEDPSYIDPTFRFMKNLDVAIRLINEIKRAFSRKINPFQISMNIASICNHKFESIRNIAKKYKNYCKGIEKNENLSQGTRNTQKSLEKFLAIQMEIQGSLGPTFCFANEKDSNRIFYSPSKKILSKYGELEPYLHQNVMKYQFMKNWMNDSNNINCFENRLSVCKNDCSLCEMTKVYELTKKLTRIVNERFSYLDLKNETMNTTIIENLYFNCFNRG